jgi:hypothetical protein
LLIPGFAAAAAGALFAVLLAAEPLARLFGAKEDVGRAIGALQMPLTVAVGSCFAGCLSASLLARKGKSNALAPSLAWGMLGFCGAAALALTPALDGALLRDFRNVVRYAGGVASQYEALVIAPKGLRRPSALFYLPDDLVRSGRVLEGRDELARRPPGDSLLVTDDKRLGGEVVREAGAWSARALQR